MAYENLIVEKEGAIATITFNRPDAMNALNNKTRAEFPKAMAELEVDDEVKVVILTGAGKAFSAGADLKEFEATTPFSAHKLNRISAIIEAFPKPVIAAVNGIAIGGGCEIAISCDIIIASEKAKFGQGEINFAVIPGQGGTQRLPRLIGVCRAKEIIYTGEPINAEEANRIGLVNRVVPLDQLMPTVKELANKIAAKSPAALRIAKMTINRGMQVGLESGLAYEREMYSLAQSLEDKLEGVKAFFEKRKPEFKGK